jgi:hypothetical protein
LAERAALRSLAAKRAPGGLLIWVLASGALERDRLLGAAFLFLIFLRILRLSVKQGLWLLELEHEDASSAGERDWERLLVSFSLGEVCSLRFLGRRSRGPGERERWQEARRAAGGGGEEGALSMSSREAEAASFGGETVG